MKAEKNERKSQGSDVLNVALGYIERDWSPIPIGHREKKPRYPNGKLITGWQNLRITAETAPQYFTKNGQQNIGILLGEPSGDLVDVDLDWPEARALADAFLPPTTLVFGRPGSSRSHRLYRVTGLQSKKYALGGKEENSIVECRSTGEQTVFPPSVHEDTGELIEWVSHGEPGTPSADQLERGVHHLAIASLLRRYYPGTGTRHDYSLAVAGTLLRAGWAEDVVKDFIEVVARDAGDEEVKDRGKNVVSTAKKLDAGKPVWALRYLEQNFLDADAARFLRQHLLTTKADQAVAELNSKGFAVVQEGDHVRIWRPTSKYNRIVYAQLRAQDFRLLLQNRFVEVMVKGKSKPIPLSKVWLEHPDRLQYDRVVFNPAPDYTAPPGVLNLWRGFAVAPTQGSWGRFDAHIRQIICNGNEDYYKYLRSWLARMLQLPHLQGEVAVVLRGLKGSGKGVFANAMVALFGQHGLRIDNPEHLTGKFNEHLRDVCCLFVDEGHWAGDKKGEGILKGHITEPMLTIEGKFKTAVSVPNQLSLIMSSNVEWVVPATPDERRFFVLDVPEVRRGDWDYFNQLHDELYKQGGLAAFLHDMLHEDLSNFNHRDVPITEALQDQVIHSADPRDRWMQERLEDGEILRELATHSQHLSEEEQDEIESAVVGDWRVGPVQVQKDALHTDFLRWCERHRVSNQFAGRDTKKMLGRYLKRWLPVGWPRDLYDGVGPRGEARYELPSLADCRRAFSRGRPGLFGPDLEPIAMSEDARLYPLRVGRRSA